MTCIRFGCRRAPSRGLTVCRDCLERIVFGRAATDTDPTLIARPGPPTAPVRNSEPWSELELRYRFGDR